MTAASGTPVLSVRDLSVELLSGKPVVQDVSLTLNAGETLGLVGESGCGKTTTALALLGYARKGMRISSGQVEVAGQHIALGNERAARALRGRLISHVPQDPVTNLNPSLRIGDAVADVLRQHRPQSADEASVMTALRRVQLATSEEFVRRFPHQLSGGQQQRVLIAAALACEPPLVVLDEPTTGLDVVTQARVLDEIARLRREEHMAMIYVSHDLAVVSLLADRVAVMYAGRVVESGPVREVLRRPRHPYARGLVCSVPDHAAPRRLSGIPGVAVGIDDRPAGCAFAPRCPQRVEECDSQMPALEEFGRQHLVRCIRADETPPLELAERILPRQRTSEGTPLLRVQGLEAGYGNRTGRRIVVNDVSFHVGRGECVALVGESGSGKTTIVRTVAGLHRPSAGSIELDGVRLAPLAKDRPRETRRRCQIIFQNPYESLNPRRRVADEIARPAIVLRGLSSADARAEVATLLERVRVPARFAPKFPGELSGGERQRVAIARALAASPELLVCDEITSALDVSVQAAVIGLLAELRESLGLSLLFITHNLGVVSSIADRVLILDSGSICEEGPVGEVFASPTAPRTRELLEAAPRLLTDSQSEVPA